jgi:hypothetical protein
MFPQSHGNISFVRNKKETRKLKESCLCKGRFLYSCVLLRFGNTLELTRLGAPPSGEHTHSYENLPYNKNCNHCSSYETIGIPPKHVGKTQMFFITFHHISQNSFSDSQR